MNSNAVFYIIPFPYLYNNEREVNIACVLLIAMGNLCQEQCSTELCLRHGILYQSSEKKDIREKSVKKVGLDTKMILQTHRTPPTHTNSMSAMLSKPQPNLNTRLGLTIK